MKGLKIIPMFLILIVLAYIGMLFVEANRVEVTIHFGSYQTFPMALGFVVLTSALVGMLLAGALCSIELFALYVQNVRLKRRPGTPLSPTSSSGPEPSDIMPPRPRRAQ